MSRRMPACQRLMRFSRAIALARAVLRMGRFRRQTLSLDKLLRAEQLALFPAPTISSTVLTAITTFTPPSVGELTQA